jgi:hypothetical protein
VSTTLQCVVWNWPGLAGFSDGRSFANDMWPACQKRREETSGRTQSLDYSTAMQRLRELSIFWNALLTVEDDLPDQFDAQVGAQDERFTDTRLSAFGVGASDMTPACQKCSQQTSA